MITPCFDGTDLKLGHVGFFISWDSYPIFNFLVGSEFRTYISVFTLFCGGCLIQGSTH